MALYFRILSAFFCFSIVLSAALADGSKYDLVRTGMRKVVAANPTTARGFDIGVSDSGLPIEGVQIGDGPVKTLVVATHHGNEFGSTYVAAQFIEALAAHPIPGHTVYVIPVLNIVGYNNRTREEPISTRASWGSPTQDPNRDYPGPCGSEGAGPFSLRSTHLLADFIDKAGVSASLTLHTYSPIVAYPWGMGHGSTDPYPDLYKQLAALTVQFSKYPIGNSAQSLYPANGTFEDYAFWKHGIWSLLMEVGTSHNPSNNDLIKMAQVNIPGMAQFLAQVPAERATNHEYDGKCYRGISPRRE